MARNPWIAIMVAAANGRGLHLSADEVFALSMDGAIAACATNDIDRAGGEPPQFDWAAVDAAKYPAKTAD
jgi:hypothetical protein